MNKPDHDAATKAANKVVADGRYDNDITDLAIAYLALEQQAPKWVAVGERLPPEGVDCAVVLSDCLAVAFYYAGNEADGDKPEWFGPGNATIEQPTHWMPLPSPPSEGGG